MGNAIEERKRAKGMKASGERPGYDPAQRQNTILKIEIVFEEIRDKNKYLSVRAPWNDKKSMIENEQFSPRS